MVLKQGGQNFHDCHNISYRCISVLSTHNIMQFWAMIYHLRAFEMLQILSQNSGFFITKKRSSLMGAHAGLPDWPVS